MNTKVVYLGGELPRRRTEPTLRDQHRLRLGAEALTLPEPTTPREIRAQLEILNLAICALQSMDDLGTDEANQVAWDDMEKLERKYQRLKALLS